jgi:hypothetical protein
MIKKLPGTVEYVEKLASSSNREIPMNKQKKMNSLENLNLGYLRFTAFKKVVNRAT